MANRKAILYVETEGDPKFTPVFVGSTTRASEVREALMLAFSAANCRVLYLGWRTGRVLDSRGPTSLRGARTPEVRITMSLPEGG